MKKSALILCIAAFLLAGCNTFAGMGKDVQKGGEKLTNTAEHVKEKM